MKNVLIAGGGTGGHISPGIALYEEFKENDYGVIFLAAKNDKRFSSLNEISDEDLFFYNAPSLTMNVFKMPLFIIKFLLAIYTVRKIIKKYNIDIVIGMGGYVSAPALMAANSKEVPVFLCEQNSVPGRVTRSFEKHALKIYGTFEEAVNFLKEQKKYVHAGNPIRKKILSFETREAAKKAFHLGHTKKVILAIGGSQGAVKINELIYGLKKHYSDEFKDIGIIWSTGEYSYGVYKEKMHDEMDGGSIYMSQFIDRVGLAYSASDIAISRSGAGVMMELAAMGIPSILIPYPFAAMDHQDKNADSFAKAGAAIKISDSDASYDKVAPVILDLLDNPRAINEMKERALSVAKKNAAEIIVQHIVETVKDLPVVKK